MGKGTDVISNLEKKDLVSFLFQIQDDLKVVFDEMELSLKKKLGKEIIEDKNEHTIQFIQLLIEEDKNRQQQRVAEIAGLGKKINVLKNDYEQTKEALLRVGNGEKDLSAQLEKQRQQLFKWKSEDLAPIYHEIGVIRNQLEESVTVDQVKDKEQLLRLFEERLQTSKKECATLEVKLQGWKNEESVFIAKATSELPEDVQSLQNHRQKMEAYEQLLQQKYDGIRNIEEMISTQKKEIEALYANLKKVEKDKARIYELQKRLNDYEQQYEEMVRTYEEQDQKLRKMRYQHMQLLLKQEQILYELTQSKEQLKLKSEERDVIGKKLEEELRRLQAEIDEDDKDLEAERFTRKRDDVMRRLRQKEDQLLS